MLVITEATKVVFEIHVNISAVGSLMARTVKNFKTEKRQQTISRLNEQANKQASKQASKQTSKQASQQTNKQYRDTPPPSPSPPTELVHLRYKSQQTVYNGGNWYR